MYVGDEYVPVWKMGRVFSSGLYEFELALEGVKGALEADMAEAAGIFFEDFEDTVRRRFAREESIIDLMQIGGLDEHQAEHTAMIDKLSEVAAAEVITLEILQELVDMLAKHQADANDPVAALFDEVIME